MKVKTKLGMLCIFLFSIGIVIVLYFGPKHHEKELEAILAASHFVENDERTEGQEMLTDSHFYTKLKEKAPIEILVIGDHFASSEGATSDDLSWYNLLALSIEEFFEVETNMNLFPSEDIFQQYMEFKLGEHPPYDLVFLFYGNEKAEAEGEFISIYEAFVKEIIAQHAKAEIISIASHEMDDGVVQSIKDIASFYGITFVDGKSFFTTGEQGLETLTVDGVLLNDQGHQMYHDKLFNYIRTYSYGNKKIDYPEREEWVNEGAELFAKLQLLPLNMVNDSISLNFSGRFVGVVYETGPDHGIFDVYLDGAYIDSIDAYDPNVETTNYTIISHELQEGDHAFTIQESLLSNENALGNEIEVTGLIVEQ